MKVTIVPRGRSLGAAWYLPEERSITTTEQILDDMCTALGGRAAEQLTFGKISTGALSDLEKITKQAYAMVSIYGLNERVGNISFYDPQGNNAFVKPYSEDTAKVIDDEVSKMVEEQYQRALQILTDNQDKLTALAEKLLEKEVIFKEDLVEIFGKRQWDKEETVEASISTKEQIVSEEKEVSSDTENSESPADTTGEQNTTNEELDQSNSEQQDTPEDKTGE